MEHQDGPDAPIFEDYTKENKDFMVNPTDFTDTVAQERRRRSIRNATRALGIIALLFALIWGTYYLLHKGSGERSKPTPQESATSAPEKSPQGNITTPLNKQYPNAPQVKSGAITLTATKEGTVKDSAGNTLAVKGKKIYNPSENCAVSEPTDFCLTGIIQDKSVEADIYYLKDAVHSRLFEGVTQYNPIQVPGSPAAGVLSMDIAGEKRRTVAIANLDSSGWMIVVKKGDPNQFNTQTSVK